MHALMQKYEAIGLSVAVVKDWDIVYAHSFGYKNREDSIPLSPNDLFRIASVSKTFVATAIMQLAELGRLSLDDDVNNYLHFKVQNPKYPEIPITVRMLLCHRSSINDSQGYKTFDKINPFVNPQFSKCYCDFAPDSSYVYCNLNYNLLGAIIENVTGKRLDAYIHENIVLPLNLHGSFNVLDLDSSLFVRAYRYGKQDDTLTLSTETYQPFVQQMSNYRLGYSTPFLSAAGGMKITVQELATYMMMHMNKGEYRGRRIISKESEDRMREVQTPESQYALSLKHYKNIVPGKKLIGQTGGAYGIHTAMIFHPEAGYGFVVFCNGCKSKSADGHELNFGIIKELYYRLIQENH